MSKMQGLAFEIRELLIGLRGPPIKLKPNNDF